MYRLLVLLALAFVPWTVLSTGELVFAWGLVTTNPVHVTTTTDYLFVHTAGLPQQLLAWPVAVLLYGLAVGSALLGSVDGGYEDRRETGYEDRRVTGGLLVIAGVSHLWFSMEIAHPGSMAFPTGTVALWTVAWWFHWPDLREAFWR